MTAIMFMTLSLSMMFLILNHPLSFGLILMMQTMLISILTGMMNTNFWFSYILFLIMVGGMLILFIYMTSTASNEKFKMSYLMALLVLVTITMIIMTEIPDQSLLNLSTLTYETLKSQSNTASTIGKYVSFPTNKIMISVISYLLITLIVVVKITNIKSGPLRQKF